MPEEVKRYGIATRLQVERVLRTKIVACYTTDNPVVVKCEMPDHTYKYVDIEVNIEVGGPQQRTPDKPVEVYREPAKVASATRAKPQAKPKKKS